MYCMVNIFLTFYLLSISPPPPHISLTPSYANFCKPLLSNPLRWVPIFLLHISLFLSLYAIFRYVFRLTKSASVSSLFESALFALRTRRRRSSTERARISISALKSTTTFKHIGFKFCISSSVGYFAGSYNFWKLYRNAKCLTKRWINMPNVFF